MGFKPISIDNYLKMYLKNNPAEKEAELRERLMSALSSYQHGEKCSCGNDIWVVGSASVGNNCYTCITGESFPTDDYEIDLAISKKENKKERRHIDDMDPAEIHGFFDDDGYEVNTDLTTKPTLCLSCIHNDDPKEELLCNLTRLDQKDEKEFMCAAYRKFKL